MIHEKTKELLRSDIFSHLPAIGYVPRWSVLLFDMLLCTIAFWLSVWIGSGVFNYQTESAELYSIRVQYLIVMGVQLITFWAFHTYSGILRYSTFIDMVKVLGANLAAGIVILIFNLAMQLTTNTHTMLNTVVMTYVTIAFLRLF